LPIPDSWPTVWVSEADAPAARALLARDATLRLVTSPWICPGCGEPNEGSFDWCWACSTPAPEH
ncbi:MAG: DUF2007 domain-containing protein, partial [Deltaproteobacteria bacterium]|nr:DUF2007 domain-containing protein [Deltaproteobacteria bacterium]